MCSSLVREACGTRGASHWAITLLLLPWGGWLKGKKKKKRNQESEQRMMRRVCTKIGERLYFPFRPMHTPSREMLHLCLCCRGRGRRSIKREGASKTNTAARWHWSSLTRKPEELGEKRALKQCSYMYTLQMVKWSKEALHKRCIPRRSCSVPRKQGWVGGEEQTVCEVTA